MSVFHQIGHDSFNLVNDSELNQYAGMVCSPLNYSAQKVKSHIELMPPQFISLFDPQLYFPRSERGFLQSWEYFPSDFETADQSNFNWWKNLNTVLCETCLKIGATHICSPCIVPLKFSVDHYKFFVEVGNHLCDISTASGLGFYQTAIIDYNSIKLPDEVENIASVLSQTSGSSIYLILKTEIEPRRELADSDSLFAIMKLIRLLSDSGLTVFVAFCSLEFLLWKYAGASEFATGKFFNLRRFTSSRFDEPSGGGGQLPYWFERGLLAYLREGDLIRLYKLGMLHESYKANPFSQQIIEQIQNASGMAWLALSWRHYLYAFAEIERSIADKPIVLDILKESEQNWVTLDKKGFLMEEMRNDGAWIRQWRIAINDFEKYFS